MAWLTCLLCGISPPAIAQPAAEFGDAPDGSDSYYPVPAGQTPVMGRFPTLRATLNSRVGGPGVHHLTVGEEWFGPPGAVPTVELDANSSDAYDDGLPPIPFFLVLTSLPPGAAVTFRVTVPTGAPDVYRYVNMLIDWDRNGAWKNPSTPGAAPEWAIVNRVIDQKPGTSQWITVPIQWGLGAQLAPQIFWLRMTLSRTMLDPAAFGPDGWDGSGVFSHGETEDFLFHPSRRHDDPAPLPPAPLPPPPTGGYYSFLPGIILVPKHLDAAHGTPAKVIVRMIDYVTGAPITAPPPAFLGWKLDDSLQGPPATPPTGFQVGGTVSWPAASGGSGTSATWNNGAPPDIASISFNSPRHHYAPSPEEWPIRVRAEWPGLHSHSCEGIVHIFHSWPFFGVFEIYSSYTILRQWIESLAGLTPVQRNELLAPADAAGTAWQQMNLAFMNVHLAAVAAKADEFLGLGLITAPERDEIRRLVEGIQLGATTPLPVPVIQTPADANTVRGVTTATANTLSAGVVSARFQYRRKGGSLTMIGVDSDPAGGWFVPWDTAMLPDGVYELHVTMETASGESGTNQVSVWVDNSVPPPAIVSPAPMSQLVGVKDITVAAVDPQKDVASCAFAITRNGVDWFGLPTDFGGEDDDLWRTRVDTGQLPQGAYQIRATMSDTAGNSTSIEWPVQIMPSYASWKQEYGITDDGEDDDCDSLSAVMEYYFGTNPAAADPTGSAYGIQGGPGGAWELWCKRRPWQDGLITIAEESDDLIDWTKLLQDPPDGSGAELHVPLSPGLPRNFARFRFIESR